MNEMDTTDTCLFCGSSEMIWGNLTAGSQHQVQFHPDGPWLTLVSTNETVRARKCSGCGNIQLYAEAT
jgi:hypothetical protein